jgi:hypothetical protein
MLERSLHSASRAYSSSRDLHLLANSCELASTPVGSK